MSNPAPTINWPKDCVAVIPCFNEAPRVGAVIAATRLVLPHVIAVDDGSTDATVAAARDAGAQVIQLKKNSGKGQALRAGWDQAAHSGFKWVLMLDGDGQHATNDIPYFFQCAERTGASLIVGNRMNDTASMPFVRQRVNRWMSRRISHLVDANVPDSQCGFRLARLDLLQQLPIFANRFEIESAMLAAFFLHGHKVEFVPVQTIYRSPKSHIRPLADTWRWLRWRLAQRAAFRACMTMRVP